METNYSVLMSVYAKENPIFLRRSIESMLNQTIVTNDFVIICDGPLTRELDDVLFSYQEGIFGHLFNIHRLENNCGLGISLSVGLLLCKNNIVARMDSDDVSLTDRCERQLRVFDTMNVDIVSGTIFEFFEREDKIESEKKLPQFNDAIFKYSKKRCPFNHPCVMYKKESVLHAGNYQDFYHLEDYYLWIRMLNCGLIGYNIQEPLLLMRTSEDFYVRRSGLKYFFAQKKLLKFMLKIGYINYFSYLYMLHVRFLISILPNGIRKKFYKKHLRS